MQSKSRPGMFIETVRRLMALQIGIDTSAIWDMEPYEVSDILQA